MVRGPTSTDDLLETVFALLLRTRGVDFRDYRRDTLRNRLVRRIEATKCPDADAFGRLLEAEPRELDRLAEAFLINVTSFFRDPDAFDALEHRVLPAVIARLERDEPVRAWCVGTATGEEAYSLAMLLAAPVGGRADPPFELLATDLDETALDVARRGRYAESAASDIPEAMRDRWLVPTAGFVEISAELRERVHFTSHDFGGPRLAPPEAVIAQFHVVLLRNVLIYFDGRLQRLGLERAATVLEPGGYLLLGPTESVPAELTVSGGPFEIADHSLRLFRRREDRLWR